MRITSYLAGLFFALSLLYSPTAHAMLGPSYCVPDVTDNISCVSQDCDPAAIGTSTMDGNQQNIVVCLRDGAGGFKWKAMTSGTASAFACPANQVVIGTNSSGTPLCANPSPYTSTSNSCAANQIMTGISNGTAICSAGSNISFGFGGMYIVKGGCYAVNPMTGACTCPAAYSANAAALFLTPFGAAGLVWCYK